MAVNNKASGTIGEILAWLSAEPEDDPIDDLAALRANLVRASGPKITAEQRRETLSGFAMRLEDISSRIIPRIISAPLPLTHQMHQVVSDLLDAIVTIGEIMLAFFSEPHEPEEVNPILSDDIEQIQTLQGQIYLAACMARMSTPSQLWQQTYELLRRSGQLIEAFNSTPEPSGSETPQSGRDFKRMLSISVAQPEGLTSRELSWLFDYLALFAPLAELSVVPPQLQENRWYWIDAKKGRLPVAIGRHAPPDEEGILYFCPTPIVRMVGEQITWLENQVQELEILGLEQDDEMLVPEVSGLPEGLSPPEALTLLQRLRDHWITPRMRETPRRKMLYDAQVCIGLRNIWNLTRYKNEDEVDISSWTVFNEGLGGYAISSKSRVETPLQAGSVVAFRYAEGMAWSICIVRWIRNDNPDKVELGLQLVAQSCSAVKIGFRGSNTNIPRPALALPPMAPTRRNRAIIAPAGSYVSRRFALLYEGSKLYVAQCRVLGLEMQTSLIELFQYEVDPYPS